MKNVHLLYLIFLISCNTNNPSTEEQVLPDKVQLIFTNESIYPITEVCVLTVNFWDLPKAARQEERSFQHAIMPQKSDTLFFDEFNKRFFSIRAFFLVNNDTIEKMCRQGGDSGEYTLTKGIVKFDLYYSKTNRLIYEEKIIKYDVH